MTNTVGSNILRRREALKMTQLELAKAVGISRPSIYKIENGITTPRAKTLLRIADALQTTVEALRTEPEPPKSIGNDLQADSVYYERVRGEYGDDAVAELNDLFARNVGLFAGGKLSQAAKDAYFRALTQAYLDCRAAAESENSGEVDFEG